MYKLRFLYRQSEVGEIESFFFESSDPLSWQAGQYLNLTMPDVPPVGADRLFSIASAPYEKQIRITTVIGPSEFKQKMNTLKKGDMIDADQVGGDFIWQDQPEKKLFIAGGIGLAAFRPIIVDRFHHSQLLNTTLLYAGKPERRPFLEDIELVVKNDKSFQKVDFVNERLTPNWIPENITDLSERLIYIAGSQEFVETLGDGLMKQGILRTQIKYDWFDNYTGI